MFSNNKYLFFLSGTQTYKQGSELIASKQIVVILLEKLTEAILMHEWAKVFCQSTPFKLSKTD